MSGLDQHSAATPARCRRIRRNHRGATTVEMLVAGCVGLFVICLAVDILRWVGHSAGQTRGRDLGARELKMACDMIARDLGPAIAMQRHSSGALWIAQDGAPTDGATYWAAPDRVIEYRLTGNGLVRHDRLTNDSIVVARPIVHFTVVEEASEIVVDLASASFGESSTLTLRLRLP